jgi:predicted dehydrogenase
MIGVGIVGCGVIGPTHARAVELDGRARVRWACDRDPAKARARVNAEASTDDHRRLLDDPDCQLVAICTPHPSHVALALEALAAGKHVVVEKPLGVDPVEVESLVAAAAQATARGQVASGIFQHRYRPGLRRLQQVIAGGDFGAPRSLALRFACRRDAAYYASDPWRGSWHDEGGGVLINQAIHSLDLATYLCGAPQAVAGRIGRRWLDCIEVEDWGRAEVRYAGGVQGELSVENRDDAGWELSLELRCDDGAVTIDGDDRLVAIDHPNQALRAELAAFDRLQLGLSLPGKDCYGDDHALQYSDIISAILAGRQPLVGIAEAAVTNHLVLGIYQSHGLDGAWVELPVQGYRQPQLSRGD